MMRKLSLCLATVSLAAAMCAAQTLDGRELTVKGGAGDAFYAPIALSYDGPVPEGTVQVVAVQGREKACPATIRDGRLVFIPNEIPAGKEVACRLKVLDKSEEPRIQITKVEGEQLQVLIDAEHFTTYHYSNENRKPFLWPVYGEGQVGVTRNHPMGEDDPEHEDHPHHKSMWTSYGDLNGADCWGEGGGSGYQHSVDVTSGSGDAYGWIKAKNVWQDKEHKPVLTEEREYRFYAAPASARMFDVKVTFTATEGDVKFGDTKEGGIMSVRVTPAIEATRSRGGVIANAQGGRGEQQCWGKPSPWCDYSGTIKDAGVRGIAVFDHPTNLRHPTRWHVRNYGLMGANCFGLSHFTAKDEERLNGDYLLPAGESLTFNYRVIVHSGDVEEAKIADRYADYATPPTASWAE